jgi:hypothetical protein
LFSVPAWPTVITLNPALFGHLDQNDPGLANTCSAGGVNYACGPVAAVNSFVFLENMYPGTYDNLLTGNPAVPQNLINTAITLSEPAFMNCAACTGGTTLANFIAGKMAYIEQQTPHTTSYVDQLDPGFGFLLPELQQNEDVELLLGFYDDMGARVGGHYVTLYGISGGTDPQNLSFVDPNGGVNQANIGYTVVGGVIQLADYGPAGTTTRIDAAVAESPIPEPGTLFLLFAAVPIILIFAVRRLEQRTS